MKIGLVSPYDINHPGGVTQHVRGLYGFLCRSGLEVKVLAPANDEEAARAIPDLINLGGTVPIPVNGSIARINLSLTVNRRIRRVLEEEAFDVVHMHEPLMPLALTVLRLSKAANVGTFHAFARSNLGYYYGKPLLKRYVRRLHRRVAVSTPAQDFVSRYFPGTYEVIPNGVDVERFALPRHERQGGPHLLFVGRLEKRKGVRHLLRAYLEARANFPGMTLTVVGDGKLRAAYERFVARHELPGITFAGYVSDAELPGHYARADIFCAPATGRESFGIVLLEAMAAGLPVVATDIDGFRQVVEHRGNGLLVPPKSHTDLARGITLLARDPALRERLARAGRNLAAGLDWECTGESILSVYHQARADARAIHEASLVHSEVPGLG
ncbi:MAG: glycosyltransferase family 4 protein [Candidatus Dormibacteria bacterium]